jgi:hypothetical protein
MGKGLVRVQQSRPDEKQCKIYLDFFTSPCQKFIDFLAVHNQ